MSVSAAGSYGRGEIVWLLSMSRADAIAADASQRDSCADLVGKDEPMIMSSSEPSLPVIARWIDVQRARETVIRSKQDIALLQMRAFGYSERDLAALTTRSRMAVRRRWHATIDEIIEVFGDGDDPEAYAHVDKCLGCGLRPRVRLSAVLRRVRGGWRVIEPEKTASVCAECLCEDLRPRIMGGSPEAA